MTAQGANCFGLDRVRFEGSVANIPRISNNLQKIFGLEIAFEAKDACDGIDMPQLGRLSVKYSPILPKLTSGQRRKGRLLWDLYAQLAQGLLGVGAAACLIAAIIGVWIVNARPHTERRLQQR